VIYGNACGRKNEIDQDDLEGAGDFLQSDKSCRICAYAKNGVFAKIKVTVK